MAMSKHTLPTFIAKRKYWIEWHFAFDKFPTPSDREEFKKLLLTYVKNYLNKYFAVCHTAKGPGMKSMSGAVNPAQTIPTQLADDVHDFFHDASSKAKKSASDTSDQFLEYFIWDKNAVEWTPTDSKNYESKVAANLKEPDVTKKQALSFNVHTKTEYWMGLLKIEWEEVSGSQFVFTLRGWFEGKNNIRLSDEGAQNKGTMNPPPPPPPPASA